MEKPVIALKSPIAVEAEAGKTYFWCSCGKSKNQPFCDGSHQGSSFTPLQYVAETTKTIYFCGCKQTGNAPMCDGTHKSLDSA